MPCRPPTTLDLFAGAGGLSLGFEAAGAECVGAVEVDSVAARTFGTMFSASSPAVFGGAEAGDVNSLPVEELLSRLPRMPDLVIGGPPCQTFSQIGRAKQRSLLGGDQSSLVGGAADMSKSLLYRYFLAVVAKARPVAFVMENVPGMRTALGSDNAMRALVEAEHLGYTVRAFLLNAAHYGVPQYRWRIFLIGIRNDLGPRAAPLPPFRTHMDNTLPPDGLPPIDSPKMLHGLLVPEIDAASAAVTTYEALRDLPRLFKHLPAPRGNGERPVDRPLPYRSSVTAYSRTMREWAGREAGETVTGNWYRFTPRDFQIFSKMAQGDRYPQVLLVANELFEMHLAELREANGAAPSPGSSEWLELRRKFVPPYRNDAFADKWRKLEMDRPSWTVTAHLGRDSYSHIHYDSAQARCITVREAARLQSFPDSFVFSGQFGSQLAQIGNAVPPLLARAIGSRLIDQLEELGAFSEPGRTGVAAP